MPGALNPPCGIRALYCGTSVVEAGDVGKICYLLFFG